MKGLILEDINKTKLVNELQKPKIIDNTDVIVKIRITTICGSDIHIIKGHIPSKMNQILGHEYVAEVVEKGKDINNLEIGDIVIGPPKPFCGYCENCQKSDYAHCLNTGIHGFEIDGTYAEYMRIPYADTCLVKVPKNIEDEKAIFVSDILTTGYHAVVKANITCNDTVVIFGAGPIGLATVAAANLFNPKIIILVGNKDRFRLEIGKNLTNIYTVCASDVDDIVKEIIKLTDGKGADVVIDAAGTSKTISQAVRCLGLNGRLSIMGIPSTDVTLPLQEVFYKNIDINMGLAHTGRIKELLQLVEENKIDLTPLITHRMNLDDIESAIDIFDKRKENVMKIIISC